MSERPRLARISTAAVRVLAKENRADFEVFLPGPNGQGPVLYRRTDAGLSLPDFQRMAEQGVSTLYVRAEDLATCEHVLEEKLADILHNPHVAPADKAEIVHGTGTAIARDLIRDSVSPEGLARAATVVDGMIGCVLNDPVVASCLLQMAGHERSTASHMFVVATLAVMLGGTAFGPDMELLRELAFAGMLHDTGKLLIPRELLNKQTPLTRDELQFIQQHPIESVRLIGDDPHVSRQARRMILQHHERVDGRGYPVGMSGADLLAGSRVLSIVDCFHAMIGPRPYRPPLTPAGANRALAMQAGRQFDPELLECWQEVFERLWSNATVGRSHEAPGEAAELSPRHEHRPSPPAPKIVHQRPKRHACGGNTMVRCVYAGRLINVSATPEEFGAPVHDISRGGLCIYAAHPMYRGEVVHLQIEADGRPTWLRSTVAWCRREDDDSYRIGLRFMARIEEDQFHQPAPVLALVQWSDAGSLSEKTVPAKKGTAPESGHREPKGEKREHAMQTLASIDCMPRPNAEAQRTAVTLALSGDVTVRLKAVDVLMKIGTKMTRQGLVTLLEDANPEVRERAVVAVGVGRVVEATRALRGLLSDSCERVALRAAGVLGKLGDEQGLRLVEATLKLDGPEARLAAQALGDITGHRFSANREGIKAARRYLEAKKALVRA